MILLALLWEFASHMKWLSGAFFPPPSAIITSLWELALGPQEPGAQGYQLEIHLIYSLYRMFTGIGIALAVGIGLGVLMGISRTAYRIIRPLVSLLAPIPALAWTPVLMLMMGLGNRTAIMVCFLAAVIPVIYNVHAGIQAITRQQIWAAQIMGASPVQVFAFVLLPGGMLYILAGLRLAVARAWRGLVASEMLAATNWGLGYLIVQSGEYLRMDVIYGSVLLIGLCGLTLDLLTHALIERKTVERWGMVTRH